MKLRYEGLMNLSQNNSLGQIQALISERTKVPGGIMLLMSIKSVVLLICSTNKCQLQNL